MTEHSAIIVDGMQCASLRRCPHCGGHFLLMPPGSGTLSEAQKTLGSVARPRVFCTGCGRLTCGRPLCHPQVSGCVPLEARLEHAEGRKTNYDDEIRDLERKGAVLL